MAVDGRRRRPAGRVRPRLAGRHQRGAGRVQPAARRPARRRPGAPLAGLGGDPGPLAGHPGRRRRRGGAREPPLVAPGFLVLLRGSDPLNGFFISVVGWWLLGSARAERQLGQVRQSLDGVRISEVMRPVGAAPGWITVRSFAETLRQRPARLGVAARAVGRRLRRGAAGRHRRRRCPSRSGTWPGPSTWPSPISRHDRRGPRRGRPGGRRPHRRPSR